MEHPISNIQWIETDLLDANDYNPNVVIGPEMRLLKVSLLKQGWLQPVLVARHRIHMSDCALHNEPESEAGPCDCAHPERFLIIDGFHRSTLARMDEEIIAAFGTKVPCAVLDITDAERKMLTVRINRAKGSHVAARMHELVTSLVREHGVPIPQLCEELGADVSEINLLLQESVFTKLEIPDHAYSRAWVPANRNAQRPKAEA